MIISKALWNVHLCSPFPSHFFIILSQTLFIVFNVGYFIMLWMSFQQQLLFLVTDLGWAKGIDNFSYKKLLTIKTNCFYYLQLNLYYYYQWAYSLILKSFFLQVLIFQDSGLLQSLLPSFKLKWINIQCSLVKFLNNIKYADKKSNIFLCFLLQSIFKEQSRIRVKLNPGKDA